MNARMAVALRGLGRRVRQGALIAVSGLVAGSASGQGMQATPPSTVLRVDSLARLTPEKVVADVGTYRGRRALHVVQANGPATGDYQAPNESMVLVSGSSFTNGTIETAVAGAPRAGGDTTVARGFVGIAFHVQPGASEFECFYLRPTNGRADDQLRRNHATQYIPYPGYTWQRLRQETPGVYESYADLEPGAWTKVRIEVAGSKAKLFVGDAKQPTLVVNDLKHGERGGMIALWVGLDTEAWFTDVTLRAAASDGAARSSHDAARH